MQQANGVEVRTRGPKAITRVLDLLYLLSGKEDGMSLAELSTAMSVPKSTFIDTLRGLTDLHYLSCRDGRYRLGPAAYHFASRIARHWSAPEAIRDVVKQLSSETRESVGFAIVDWEIGHAIYTEAINSPQHVRYAMQAGLRAPLYASAAGRVLLAFSAPDQVEDYLAHAHPRPLTDKTQTSPDDIRRSLKIIREQGYCASFGEMLSDTAAVSVPVTGPDGDLLGALMMAAPLDRMKQDFDRFLNATVEAGRRASAGS